MGRNQLRCSLCGKWLGEDYVGYYPDSDPWYDCVPEPKPICHACDREEYAHG